MLDNLDKKERRFVVKSALAELNNTIAGVFYIFLQGACLVLFLELLGRIGG